MLRLHVFIQSNRSVRLSPDFPNKNPAPSQKIHKTDITELYAFKSSLLKWYNGIAQFNVLGNRAFCPASAFIQKLITLNIQKVNKDFPLVLVGLGYFATWMHYYLLSLFRQMSPTLCSFYLCICGASTPQSSAFLLPPPSLPAD